MNLYIVSRNENGIGKGRGFAGYDCFNSIVVAAESEEQAVTVPPTTHRRVDKEEWPEAKFLQAVLIGTAKEDTPVGVLHSSYHSG